MKQNMIRLPKRTAQPGISAPLFFQEGFSLMEVLVGVMIVGITFATLFELLSSSMQTVTRIQDREQLVRLGQSKLNELVLEANQGQIVESSGNFDIEHRWQARIENFDSGERAAKSPYYRVVRILLKIIWQKGQGKKEFLLETLTWTPNG